MNTSTDYEYEYSCEDTANVISIDQKRQQILNDIINRRGAMTRELLLVSDTENDELTRELLLVSGDSAKDTINDLQDEVNVNSIKTREVLKDKKIERSKDCSLASHEEPDGICLRPGIGEEQTALSQNPFLEEILSSPEEICCIADTNTTSRVFTGITAQQAIGKNLKVFVTLQTADMSNVGGVVKLTAELKRPKRICELKPCDGDTDSFAADFEVIKSTILSMSLVEREGICLGRLHDCGKRDLWFANMCLLGKYNENDVLESVTVYVDNEEYQINMNQAMSPAQLNYYKCSGIYGTISKNKSHPTWQTANVVVLK
jgi:hypothetical protein